MNKNIKRILFVTTLLILLFAISSVSANDVSEDTTTVSNSVDTVTTTDADTTNSVNNDNTVTDTATKDNNKNLEINDVEKQMDKNISDKTLENKKEEINEKNENNIPTVNNEKNLKNDGEPNVIDITEDNFATYFKNNQFNLMTLGITTDTVFNLKYIPSNQKELKFLVVSQNPIKITFVGKNNLTLDNVYFQVQGSNAIFKDMNFIYNGSCWNNLINFMWMSIAQNSPKYPIIFDNVTVNYNGEYVTSDDPAISPVIVSTSTYSMVIINNSEINAEVPAIPEGYEVIRGPGISLINNNITIKEKYAVDDSSSLIAIGLQTATNYPMLIDNNKITVLAESDACAISFSGDSSNITNNQIIVTGNSAATGVEINGNDNKVTDNKILAYDKTGNDAVTAIGENNVVENNIAAEVNTRIPTNIELNYDTTPIDVGQQLTIRGVFTTEGQDAAAEGIKIYDNEEELTSINTDEDGTIIYTYTPTVAGDHNITFKFEGNETHKETETTISITANEHIKEYTIQVDTTEFTAGTTTTISASIYADDEKATDINKGKVTFKVNGKTLKDTNGKVIYAKVTGGVATIENYEVPADWAKNGTTIQAVYSGSSDVAKMSSEKTEITVTPKELTLTTSDVEATAGTKITLTATLNDDTINTGKIVFKINGKTVKDENGKVIYTKVVNGSVNVQYTLPADMKAKEYNLTAVFISSDYERLEDTKTLTIN